MKKTKKSSQQTPLSILKLNELSKTNPVAIQQFTVMLKIVRLFQKYKMIDQSTLSFLVSDILTQNQKQ